jgi:hypothetical protein
MEVLASIMWDDPLTGMQWGGYLLKSHYNGSGKKKVPFS